MCPTKRPGTQWYDLNITGWTEDLINALGVGMMKNLAIMDGIKIEDQKFEEDGTHFIKEAGAIYVQQMITYGKQMPINKPPQKQIHQDQLKKMEVDLTHTPSKKPWQSKDSLEDRVRILEEGQKEHTKNFKSCNLAISKIREELDADTNERKMDSLVLFGVRPNTRHPITGSFRDKNDWAHNEATRALKKFDKNISDRDIKWANTISNPSVTPVSFEIKLGNRETSTKIKMIFRNLKRDDMKIPEDMYIANSYTQATRVRIEIMKAITKKCATETERMFLHQFCNRPFVRIINTRTKKERVLTYTDLIENFGYQMKDKELEMAYRRAGFKFRGQMKQIFGILKDIEDLNQTQTQGNRHNDNGNNTPLGTRKRRAQEDEKHNKKAK